MAKIDVKGISVTVYSEGDKDFISLTDMLKAKDGVSSSPTGCATATPWNS